MHSKKSLIEKIDDNHSLNHFPNGGHGRNPVPAVDSACSDTMRCIDGDRVIQMERQCMK